MSHRPARRTSAVVGALLSAALLGGCAFAEAGALPDNQSATSGSGVSGPAAEPVPAPDVRLDPAHGPADVAFVSAALVHHQLSVQLAELMAAEERAPEAARNIAGRVSSDQGPHVETLSALLRLWGEPLPETAALQLDALGPEFARATALTRDGIGLLQDQADSDGFTPFWILTLRSHEDSLVEPARAALRGGRSSTVRRLAEEYLRERRALEQTLTAVDA